MASSERKNLPSDDDVERSRIDAMVAEAKALRARRQDAVAPEIPAPAASPLDPPSLAVGGIAAASHDGGSTVDAHIAQLTGQIAEMRRSSTAAGAALARDVATQVELCRASEVLKLEASRSAEALAAALGVNSELRRQLELQREIIGLKDKIIAALSRVVAPA